MHSGRSKNPPALAVGSVNDKYCTYIQIFKLKMGRKYMNNKKVKKISRFGNHDRKGIKHKIKVAILSTASLVAILIGIIIIPIIYINFRSSTYHNLQEFVQLASQRIASEMDSYKKSAFTIAQNPIVCNTSLPFEDRYAELGKIADLQNFNNFGITNSEGINYQTKKDVSNQLYFQYAKNNKNSYIGSPIVYEDKSGIVSIIMISAPIIVDNEFEGIVFFSIDAKSLSQVTNKITFGSTGSTTIINNNGTVIADNDYENKVLKQFNAIEAAKTDSSMKELAQINEQQIREVADIKAYNSFNKTREIIAFAPIESTDWSISVTISNKEIMMPVFNSLFFCIAILVISLIISYITSNRMSNSIASPVLKSIDRIRLLADGDLHTPVEQVKGIHEMEILSSSTQLLVERFSDYINDILHVLLELASGNLNAQSKTEYSGDFKPIREASDKIISALNRIMYQISQSAKEVNLGAENIAKGATAVAKGATKQANVIDNFTMSTKELSDKIIKNIEQVNKTDQISKVTKGKADQGMQVVDNLLFSMNDINKSSNNIADIIKIIDSIANQTNLLALNAAIESARAGEAGKGFSVVASEIRDLANNSSQTVKKIEEMIKECLINVEKGQTMAQQTAEAFHSIIRSVEETSQITNILLESSEQQKIDIEEMVDGTNQLSRVIDSNSSISQESAAVAEELEKQAENLKELINFFKLKKEFIEK